MSQSTLLLLRAAAFAADKHRNQRRKDHARTPYINHPLAVARVLAEEGGVKDPEILAAAILHDTLEDNSDHPQRASARVWSPCSGFRLGGDGRQVTPEAAS